MRLVLITAALLLSLGTPAYGQIDKHCADGMCAVRLKPDQLLAAAEKLVSMGKFDEARPLIEALRMAPGYALQTRFLTGYIDAEQGHYQRAADQYKAILADDPSQTRVRLELGKMMLALGQPQSADRQFRIAGQDQDLPPDLAKAIRGVRAVIRQKRAWRFDVDFGLAPDSNINNATSVDQINVNLGGYTLPLTLDDSAKARSGTGLTGTLSAGLRLPVAKDVSMLIDGDAGGTNYAGAHYDDYSVQLAAGPELQLSQTASVFAELVGAQRWYGGRIANRQIGIKAGGQKSISLRERGGAQIDLRKTDSRFDTGYDGWQLGVYTSLEHAVSKSLVASAGLFARRDWLNEQAYSSAEFGVNSGIGGELPHGVNFSLSGSVSRARFDAPMLFFSAAARRDWRVTARATLGYRRIRVFGFSPELSLAYSRNQSNLALFSTDRLRFRAALARYF